MRWNSRFWFEQMPMYPRFCRLIALTILFGTGLTLAPGIHAQDAPSSSKAQPAAKLFVGQLDALEARIIRGHEQIQALRKLARDETGGGAQGLAPLQTAERARQKVHNQVVGQLVAWERAHRHAERAARLLPAGEAADTRILLAVAEPQALRARVGDIDALQSIALDVRRTREGALDYAQLHFDIAQASAEVRTAEEERQKLVEKARAAGNRAQLGRELAQSDQALQESLGMTLKNTAEADFHRYKGTLRPPVSAPVAVGFAPQKQPNSMSYVRHSGLTFAVEAGTSVHAVAAGLVVFAGTMEGFGQVIIIDHGQQYHSVYAHLKSLELQVGDTPERGARIGESGQSGSFDGPKLYFELRKDGLPIDPVPWFVQP